MAASMCLLMPSWQSELAGGSDNPRSQSKGYELQAVHNAVIALRSAKNMVWDESDTTTWGQARSL